MEFEKISAIAGQMMEVCSRIRSIANTESDSDLYMDMLYDNVEHAQKLVVEVTKLVLGSEEHEDGVFFAGDLTDVQNGREEEDEHSAKKSNTP